MTTTATVENVPSVNYPTYNRVLSTFRSSHVVGVSIACGASALALLSAATGYYAAMIPLAGLAFWIGVPRSTADGVVWCRKLPRVQLTALAVLGFCMFLAGSMLFKVPESSTLKYAGFSPQAGFDVFLPHSGMLMSDVTNGIDVLATEGVNFFTSGPSMLLATLGILGVLAACCVVVSTLATAHRALGSLKSPQSTPKRELETV